jgi:hypothetical protein
MRVVQDPLEAREIVSAIVAAELQRKYPDAPQVDIDQHAASEADAFVRDMKPNANNSQDSLRLIRVESTDESPVSPNSLYEEIKFRGLPGLAQDKITADEVLYSAINPIDPRTLLE